VIVREWHSGASARTAVTAAAEGALSGPALLADPWQNRGTAFDRDERRRLGLEALLPWQVETLGQQVQRVRRAFDALDDDLARYALVQSLRRSNGVLFHRFLEDHIEAVLPVVYTPTVGRAVQCFSRDYRTPIDGLFLAAPQQGRLEELLRQAVPVPPDLLLVTDSEGILGLGDQGIGGIEICLGKLAVYTLCAGLDPRRTLAVVLDVGTDNPTLLSDPLYPGLRQPRLDDAAYDGFVDSFVAAVAGAFPGAVLHWEDFGARRGRRLLERHRLRLPSFNDDIQGTSGVAAAAVLAGSRGLGRPLTAAPIVIFGAGSAGCGIADRLVRLLQREGLTEAEARQRIWAIDRQGLVLQGQAGVSDAALVHGRRPAEVMAFARAADGTIPLLEVVRQVRPGVLIGTSTVAGAFSRPVIEALLDGIDRPLVLPLSNPTALAEATPADVLAWSDGRALVATGSPFPPVGSRLIGQCNNCFLFPGLGFAAVAVGARAISDGMIDAALGALAERIPAAADPEASLMPPLREVQAVSAAVAEAAALAAVAEGLASRATDAAGARRCLAAARWRPQY
jgi:malate dehydrogenase (oxaloacetate-decarboxylating)